MEQPFASLSLQRNRLKELKLLGYEYLPRDNSSQELFDENEYENLVKPPKTKTALDLYKQYSNEGTICTFIRGLDSLLQDEIVSGNIIELCGKAGSGKTQICFHLCVNVQLPTLLGGRDGEALYVCSNYNFSKRRIEEIAASTIEKLSKIDLEDVEIKLSIEEILSKITHIQIGRYQELIAVGIHLKTLVKHKKIHLLIIDSITSLAEQIEYKNRKHILYTFFSNLQKLADEHGFVIIITSNLTLRNKTETEIAKVPALGENFYHRINSRIELNRLAANYYKATLVKSVCNDLRESFFSF